MTERCRKPGTGGGPTSTVGAASISTTFRYGQGHDQFAGALQKVKALTNLDDHPRPLGDVMREAHRTLVSYLERALREAGYDDVGAAHASVLATVDGAGARLSSLVERGGRTKQATAELAGHLVARGYLELHPDPLDGRAKRYLRTPAGQELLAACGVVVTGYEAWLEGVLGVGGVERLRQALLAIVERGA